MAGERKRDDRGLNRPSFVEAEIANAFQQARIETERCRTGTGAVSQGVASSAGVCVGVVGAVMRRPGARMPDASTLLTEGRRAWMASSSCIGIQTVFWLAGAEGDDAPDRIVGRYADGHAISRNHFDAEAAHSAAELGQHFVAGVALHAVKAATVDGNHGALHVNQIVLAQSASNPFS